VANSRRAADKLIEVKRRKRRLLSELYEAFRRNVGADERPARVVPEAAVIEDTRFRSIDGKFDALSHTMDQRFDALSQRFDVLNPPRDGLSGVMDHRFDALNHAMDQRFGTSRGWINSSSLGMSGLRVWRRKQQQSPRWMSGLSVWRRKQQQSFVICGGVWAS
jgi:hypothetical protein